MSKLPKVKNTKEFWNHCKSYFTNAYIDENIIIVENDKTSRNNSRLSQTFSHYCLVNITHE